VDAYTVVLSRTFNDLSADSPLQPIVYGTFQAYLRRFARYTLIQSFPHNHSLDRGRSHLVQSLEDAEDGNYALGVKLVRGAYHEQEAASNSRVSISPEAEPPVYLTKVQTDASFNECARILVDRISLDARQNSRPRISALFGTHNMESCRLVISLMEQGGLAKTDQLNGKLGIPLSTASRIAFGQLFGTPTPS
jgi:proline dehydrogenase